jgi:hypothetical protein
MDSYFINCWRVGLTGPETMLNRQYWRYVGGCMTSGVGGDIHIVHRIQRSTKFLMGARPRTSNSLPMERRAMQLFHQLSSQFGNVPRPSPVETARERVLRLRQQLLRR